MRSKINHILEIIIQILFKSIGVGWGGRRTVVSEVRHVRSIIRDGTVFIDCGANKGNYSSELIRKFQDIELHIFEPSLKNIKILLKRFKENSNIKINHLGLSDKACDSLLYSNESGSGLASLTKRRLDHHQINFDLQEKVRLVTLFDYWNARIHSEHIDFLKIDVEGHEMNVLKGIGAKITNIKLIQFEFGGCNIDSRVFFQDFWYFFSFYKFKIFRISPFGLVKLYQYKEIYESFSTTNFLCLNTEFIN